LHFGAITFAGTIGAALRPQGAILMAGLFASTREVGYFSAGFAIVSLLLFLPGIVGTALTLVVAYHHGKGHVEEVRRLIEAGTEYAALLAALAVVPLIHLAFFVLQFFFDSSFAFAAAPTLRILLASVFLTMVIPATNTGMAATDHVREPNIGMLLGLGAAAIVWAILVPRMGIEGAAWGYFAGSLVAAGFVLMRARTMMRVSLGRTGAIIGTVALLVLLPIFLRLDPVASSLAAVGILLGVFHRLAAKLVGELVHFWRALRDGRLLST
jgi:O-antigen/teichoic acid export membrane protein